MSVVPDVARSWDVFDGGRRYVFHLRDDVLWSDGVPVTARDFEYAWKRVLDPATGSSFANFLYDVRGARAYHQGELEDPGQVGVRALDGLTLEVELEGPTGYFPYLLTCVTTAPVPRHVAQEHGAAWTQLPHIVTNGPFRLVSWERGASMVLARSTTYHGEFAGNLESVHVMLDPQGGGGYYGMYETDRLEVTSLSHLSQTEEDRARQRYAGEHVTIPILMTNYVGFNVRRPPFNDRRVRRALATAIDRETLADQAHRGSVSPATGGLLPPGMPGHSPEIGLHYDPEGARRLLAEAGYPDGRGFPAAECLASAHSLRHVRTADFVRAQWREQLGLELTWTMLGWGALLDRLIRETPPVWLMGWYADYPDPDNFLRAAEWRAQSGWRNEVFDELVEDARRILDQAERVRMYQQADTILVEEAPVTLLTYGRGHLLAKPWVRSYPWTPFGGLSWKGVVIEPH
jgi:oligopeptide transport system substrate-binding protein